MRTISSLVGMQCAAVVGLLASAVPGLAVRAQIVTSAERPMVGLTLTDALAMAGRASPELTAAREAVAAAIARERQAGALANPTVSYQHEQTARNGARNSQNIASMDQAVELGGVRGARTEAARLRREIATARLSATQAQLDFDVTQAFALAVAAVRQGALAQQAANAFAQARTVSESRLAQGDVSGYANRRIRLEAARYAGLHAEAVRMRQTARRTLASLISARGDSLGNREPVQADSLGNSTFSLAVDSLHSLADRHRAELRIATLEAEVAAADARVISRERTPVPVLSAGFKNEQAVGGERFNGFVAGISLPVPLWDRRTAALDAAGADARRRLAEGDVVRRHVSREIDEAAASLRAVDEQIAILRPQLGTESQAAIRAAQIAYSEGEITLVDWLDSVRAYQEAETTFAQLRAQSLIRRAALARAVGLPLSRDTR